MALRLAPGQAAKMAPFKSAADREGPFLVGRTLVGRTTVEVLAMNAEEMIRLREALIEEEAFPPTGT